MNVPASHRVLYRAPLSAPALRAAQRQLAALTRPWTRRRRRPVEQAIVRQRLFGTASLGWLAREYGISRERVRQIEAQLLADLIIWRRSQGGHSGS